MSRSMSNKKNLKKKLVLLMKMILSNPSLISLLDQTTPILKYLIKLKMIKKTSWMLLAQMRKNSIDSISKIETKTSSKFR